ncbi:MAG TPA: hypothetical protein VIY48_16170 [Candidatus Paceibacterota bacterium]
MNSEIASVSLLAITSSISIFNNLCPPLHEVRQATPANARVVNDVRVAEIAAVSLTVAIGLTGSGLTKSPVPAVLSIVAAGALVAMYEGVLNTTPHENKGTVK